VISKTCPICGKIFNTKPSSNRKEGSKYCSSACWGKSKTRKITRQCLFCGKEIITIPYRIKKGHSKYCSIDCRNKSRITGVVKKCQTCGKERIVVPSLIKKGLGRYCSVKCVPNSCMSHKKFTPERLEMQRKHLKKLGMKQRGSGNPMWRGGVTPINKLIRDSTKYKEWRQSVFIRDSFTCQHCNSFSRRDLEAHHKVAFQILKEEAFRYMPLLDRFEAAITYSPLWDISNGITLCKKCHDKIPKKSRGKNEKNKV